MSDSPQQPRQRQVGRQIKLPTRKAVEIAWKNIRLRLSRSLLVTSGIVLALAFLTYILTGENTLSGMRQWIRTAPESAEFKQLDQQLAVLNDRIAGYTRALHAGAERKPSTTGKKAFDAPAVLGAEWAQLQREMGALPLPPAQLQAMLTADAELVQPMREWLAATRQAKDVRTILGGPQRLVALMRQAGAPTSESEIHANRVQTRWLIGLALLVAFVGILNAMLMSVTERFREIGTMKCLGALDSFIVKLFVIESFFQGVTGTLMGIALGLLLNIAGVASAYGNFAWKMFPVADVAISALICFLVGVLLTVAGAAYPAWQAAKMHPIEAMRVEA
jgi:ABC-type antimicrobial peptide transport system permease subunit